jgi:hypothetical protein
MAGPLIVGAEDVILVPNRESYAASRPVTEGLELILQLKVFPTSRLIVLAGTEDEQGADHFCKLNGLMGASAVGIFPEDRHEEPWLAQWYNISRQRAAGPIRMVITSYPEVYEKCGESHQPVLLFARYGMIAHASDPESWDQLTARVKRSREATIETIDKIESQQGEI